MKKKNKFVKISTSICPRVTDVMELYPWHNVILLDNSGIWFVFEDTNDALDAMASSRSLHLIY